MSRPFSRIGVAGAGAMGRGIAQLYAQAGFPVVLFDTQPAAVESARAQLSKTFSMLAEKGRMTAEQATAAAAAVQPGRSVADFAGCDLVIEAIIERLDIKRAFFGELEAVLPPEAVIASNTSSLSITALAAGCKHPQRVAGYHFFNPVPLMKVVEVVAAPRTLPDVVERLAALARLAGHTPVVAADTPGFIVNHAGRAFGTEALRLVGEGVASFATVDRIMREQVDFDGQGFRLGPFELMDLTGLDVSHFVMESIYRQYYEEARYRPSVIGAQRVAAGLFGRKTGEGFYRHTEQGQQTPAEPPVPAGAARPRVWVAPGPAHRTMCDLVAGCGGTLDAGERPADDSLILLAPLGLDATTAALDDGLDPPRVVALDTLFPYALRSCKRRTIMTTPATLPAMRDAAHALLAADGTKVSVIADSAGFVSQRIVAMIVAIGSEIAQQSIATPADIDAAVRLGLGYPKGPLAMGDHLGGPRVAELLANMHRVTGDMRYRPCLWLHRRARLGLPLASGGEH